MNKLSATILFVILYFWASKIIDDYSIEGTIKHSGILAHTEGKKDWKTWIFDSKVCMAGKIVFFLWTLLVLINLVWTINSNILLFLSFLTMAVTACLNMPLFIRSLPAFMILNYPRGPSS